jgi:hypothetical protein
MSEQQLRDLLRDKAEPVEAPALAESSWRLAGVRRRRRHATVGAVAAVLAVALVGGGLLTAGRDPGQPAPGTHASAQPSATYHLPVAPTQLPRTIDTDPRHAEKLSTHPLDGPAVGLFAAYPKGWPERFPQSTSVLVLGQDGRMRLIDTATILSSGDGYDPAPVLPGSLSPSGTKAAFPQMNGRLLVVDLTGASSRQYLVSRGETVDSMWWIGDGTIAASTDASTHLIELRSKGSTRTMEVSDALAPRRPTARSELVSFVAAPAGTNTEIRRFSADGQLLDSQLSTHAFTHWYGPGFADGTRAVRTAVGTKSAPEGGGSSIVVLPLRGGGLTETVDCPGGNGRHQKVPCVILGWPQSERLVVLDHARATGQLLSVDLPTEKVSVAADLTQDAQVALRPGVY